MAVHERKDDVLSPVKAHSHPVLHDEQQVPAHHDETPAPATPHASDPTALLPFIDDWPHAKPLTPSLPLANPDDLKSRADRMQAEQLLKSKRLETGADASKAVDLLLQVDDKHRAKVIDDLDPKAFQNLLERVPESEREKIEGLVDASQNPKRKLQMWAMVHKARASNDLEKYKGDFGDPDGDQTKEQERKQNAFERRQDGVQSDSKEVDAEVARMMARADKGQVTIAEIDEMRRRKDLELNVETKYNVNLIAQSKPRDDGSAVEWTKADLLQTQASLSQIPMEQLRDPKMATTLLRRASIPFQTPRAEYRGSDHVIDVYDGAESSEHQARVIPPRSNGAAIDPLEYSLTHEIGHNVADENHKAYEKFKTVANWEDKVDEKQIRNEGATDDDVKDLEAIRRGADIRQSVQSGDKRFSAGNYSDKGNYASVDATAVPDTPHMTYAATNSQEHFAEVYAQAVLSPETLYKEYVADPAHAAAQAQSAVKQQREVIAAMEANPAVPASAVDEAKKKLSTEESKLKLDEKAQRQQGQEFAIMRNDVFHTDKAQGAAESRLHAAGVSPERLAEFRERASHAATPQQIETLEHEVKARK